MMNSTLYFFAADAVNIQANRKMKTKLERMGKFRRAITLSQVSQPNVENPTAFNPLDTNCSNVRNALTF